MRISDWSSDVCSSYRSMRTADAHPCAQCLAQHEGGSPKPIVSKVRQPAFPCARWMLAIPSGGLKRVYGYDTARSEEHTSELQSLMRISYAVLCLKKKIQQQIYNRSREWT